MMVWQPSIELTKESKPMACDWNRDEFLAMVSHEVLNSTHIIISWVELMCRRAASDESLSQGLEVIRRNAQQQARLIKQLLAFSRKQSGDLRSDTSLITLRPILEAVIKTMTPLAVAKEVNLNAELGSAAASVIGDAVQLEEIFTNLLSNAIKFTPAGGRVELRFRCLKDCAHITVSDTGRGISAEFLPYIFERFRQEKGNPSEHEGLGLGLAIVRYLVEKHHGEIHAFSRGEGKGATFKVCFPLAPGAVAQTAPAETWATLV